MDRCLPGWFLEGTTVLSPARIPGPGTLNVQFCSRLGRTLAWPPAMGRAGRRDTPTEKRTQSPAPTVGADVWPLRRDPNPSLSWPQRADQSPDLQGGQCAVTQGAHSRYQLCLLNNPGQPAVLPSENASSHNTLRPPQTRTSPTPALSFSGRSAAGSGPLCDSSPCPDTCPAHAVWGILGSGLEMPPP